MARTSQVTLRSYWHIGFAIALLCVCVITVIAPLLTVFWRGLQWPDSATAIYIATVMRATLWQAVLSTLGVACVALPIAWAMVQSPGRVTTVLHILIGVPFVMPTPVVATMFAVMCAPQSWCATVLHIDIPQGLALVVLVHVWYNISVVVRIVVERWLSIRGRYTAAAATLGASAWYRFRTVEWPLILPAFVAGLTLVFLYCIGSFGVVLLLGGGTVPSLEVETWRQTSQLLRLDVAASLAFVQLVTSYGLLVVSDRLQSHTNTAGTIRHWQHVPLQTALIAKTVLWVSIVLLMMPFVVLLARVFEVDVWALWPLLWQPVRGSGLFLSPVAAIVRSVEIAGSVALITVCIGWIASGVDRRIRVLTMLPMGMSAVTLGLGYLLWFGRWGVLTAWWLIIVAHVVIALPLVTRHLASARQQLTSHYREAAATLGASPFRQFVSIEAPLLRRAILVAGLFGFSISLGDFAASLLLTRPDAVTAPVYVARLLGKPGMLNFQLAQVVALLLALCSVVATLGAEVFASPKHK